jgi:hypothetical protein
MTRNGNSSYRRDSRHQNPVPPGETGRRISTIPRGDNEELRISWDEFNSHPYLSLRLWTRDRQGRWWPDARRGLSIRLRELEDVRTALDAAVVLVEEYRDGLQRDRQTTRANTPPTSNGLPRTGGVRAESNQKPQRSWHGSELPGSGPSGPGHEFSEFDT